ncbi:MAG: hypothetical protein KA140_00815 [Caldisericia bacterium]|nr:hypothetical protein [Caldisericia bacterium]
MQYSMLLGTQILGSLIASGHNGSVKIKSNDEIFTVWISSGSVTSLRNSKASEQDTLPSLLLTTDGGIEIKSETITIARLNYQQALEKTILESKSDFKTLFPLSSFIQVSACSSISPDANLTLSENIKLLQNKSGAGTDLVSLQEMIPKDFWNTFVLASSIGCVTASYRNNLSNCVKRYHEALDAEIKKFMGAAISQTFNKKVNHSIIEWKDQFTNPVYGAKPFEAWVKAIQISALEIVPSSISEKMLSKIYSMLKPDDQTAIKKLS